MTAAPIITEELAQRVEDLLRDWRRTGRAPSGAAQSFASLAREKGVGFVEIDRHRAWIDERIHEGVLIRLRAAEERAQRAEDALSRAEGGETSDEFDQ